MWAGLKSDLLMFDKSVRLRNILNFRPVVTYCNTFMLYVTDKLLSLMRVAGEDILRK